MSKTLTLRLIQIAAWLFILLSLARAVALPAHAAGGTVINLSGARISESSLGVADFTGDGRKEIVAAGIDGMVYVIDGATRTVLWQQQMARYLAGYTGTDIESSVTVADLNRDGRLEIIVATGDDPLFHQVGAVLVFTYVGGSSKFTLLPGWPRLAFDEQGDISNPSNPDGVPDGFEATPAAGDIDGDGDLEIVITGIDRRLHAWHHTGQYVTGWPIDRSRGLWRGGASSPALADIDKDGLLEVIVGTYSFTIPACPNPYVFLALNGDGSVVPGFPTLTTQNISSSPAIGDINGDGWLDIVVGTGGYSESCPQVGSKPDGLKVYAWDHNGRLLPGWPKITGGNMGGSPALGDLDGDGDLEVVIGCGVDSEFFNPACPLLYAWHGDGRAVSGFPVNPVNRALPYSPVLADYDGDGKIEIMVVGLGSTAITIVEPNGQVSSDKSRTTAAFLYAPPVVDDIDKDGLLETIIGGANSSGRGAIYIWEETGSSFCRTQPWPMFHHDVARTGLYTPSMTPRLGAPAEIRMAHSQDAGPIQTQTVTLQNLGGCSFNWRVSHTIPKLQVSPASGTASTQATFQLRLDTTGYPQNRWHHVGNLTISALSSGQPVINSPKTVALWLYTGQLKTFYFPIIGRGP